jgi:hypothetical protein
VLQYAYEGGIHEYIGSWVTQAAYIEFETRTRLRPGLRLEENPDLRKSWTRTREKSWLVFEKART